MKQYRQMIAKDAHISVDTALLISEEQVQVLSL